MLEHIISGIGQFTIYAGAALVVFCGPLACATCVVKFTGSKE